MNWTQHIQQLIDSGMAQTAIARACQCSQTYISKLLTGKRAEPSYRIGVALMQLAKRKVKT